MGPTVAAAGRASRTVRHILANLDITQALYYFANIAPHITQGASLTEYVSRVDVAVTCE